MNEEKNIMKKIFIVYNGKEIEYDSLEWTWDLFEDGSVKLERIKETENKRIKIEVFYSNVTYKVLTVQEEVIQHENEAAKV